MNTRPTTAAGDWRATAHRRRRDAGRRTAGLHSDLQGQADPLLRKFGYQNQGVSNRFTRVVWYDMTLEFKTRLESTSTARLQMQIPHLRKTLCAIGAERFAVYESD